MNSTPSWLAKERCDQGIGQTVVKIFFSHVNFLAAVGLPKLKSWIEASRMHSEVFRVAQMELL